MDVRTFFLVQRPCFHEQPSLLHSEKDRTSRTSKLSRMESVRFQRAMDRIWLMSVLFGPRRFGSRPSLANKIQSDLEKSWKDQKIFLQKFSTPELFQIDNLVMFLTSIASWSTTAEGRDSGIKREKCQPWNISSVFPSF